MRENIFDLTVDIWFWSSQCSPAFGTPSLSPSAAKHHFKHSGKQALNHFLPSVCSLVVIITPGRAWMVIIKFPFLSFTFTNRPWKQDLGHSFSVTRWRGENYAMACRKSLTISLGCPRRTSFNLYQNPVEGRQSSPLLPLHSSFPSLFL